MSSYAAGAEMTSHVTATCCRHNEHCIEGGFRNDDMLLLNYSTKIEAHRMVSEITAILVQHGASRIMQEYDGSGNIVALKWSLAGRYGTLGYAMSVNYETVYEVLTDEGRIFKGDAERRKAVRLPGGSLWLPEVRTAHRLS